MSGSSAMMFSMIIVGFVFAALAAALHCYIFYMETFAWTSARVRNTFGTTEEEAEVTRSLAFNQGFYNLFLAIAVFVGLVVYGSQNAVGSTLILVGVASMFAAALVLGLSDRTKLRAAVTQGVTPAIAVVAIVIGLLA